MTAALTPRNVVIAVLMLLLAAVPVYAAVTANTFLVTLFTRVIILGIAIYASKTRKSDLEEDLKRARAGTSA